MSLRDLYLRKLHYEEETLDPLREIKDAVMVEVDGAVSLPRQNGRRVWVQDLQTTQVFVAYNPKLQVRIGLPVLIAPDPKLPYGWRIIDADWEKIERLQGYDGSPFLPNHASDHEWPPFKPGPDAVTFYPRAYSELRVQPYGGMEIQISSYTYVKEGQFVQYLGETGYDLTSSMPAVGLARWVLIGLNKDTNLIETVEGDTTVDTYTIWPPKPAVPDYMEVSALVRVDGSQTSIEEIDIWDVRQLLGMGSAVTMVTGAASSVWTLPMCGA